MKQHMTISLRDDVMYIMLDKIDQAEGTGKRPVSFQATDFTGRELTIADFLGHLDYLNQKQFVDVEFSGNAYATQEDVPDLINIETDTLDFRVANTFGASDGPLPHLIQFSRADLTGKGRDMLKQMKLNPPAALKTGLSTPVVSDQTNFLEKVALRAELSDVFDAKDLTTVVYRTMRDLMTTEASKAIESELHTEVDSDTSNERLKQEIADLWQDDNPFVAWISRIRSPLKFDADMFIRRIELEGGVPRGTSGIKVIKAVFSATKAELSQERIEEVSTFLPGKIREMWEMAPVLG